MILVLVSSLFISSRAHVGAEDEDVASPVLTTDSTAVLCRTYSGNGGSCCSQESRQPLFGSHLCPASKSVQLKSARPLQLRNKTIPLLANCVFPCRVADPHYDGILLMQYLMHLVSKTIKRKSFTKGVSFPKNYFSGTFDQK